MNTKPKGTRLILDFKQVQRLPEWPICKPNNLQQPLEIAPHQKLTLPLSLSRTTLRAQSHAE